MHDNTTIRYEEDKFRKVDPPSKKKKTDDNRQEDTGWESGGAKKKTQNRKPPAPLTFPGFSPKVAEMLGECHAAGIVTKGELDERVMEDLKALPERGLLFVKLAICHVATYTLPA